MEDILDLVQIAAALLSYAVGREPQEFAIVLLCLHLQPSLWLILNLFLISVCQNVLCLRFLYTVFKRDLLAFDNHSWFDMGMLESDGAPSARAYHGFAASEETLYVFGGIGPQGQHILASRMLT